jgi:hypothetical protein
LIFWGAFHGVAAVARAPYPWVLNKGSGPTQGFSMHKNVRAAADTVAAEHMRDHWVDGARFRLHMVALIDQSAAQEPVACEESSAPRIRGSCLKRQKGSTEVGGFKKLLRKCQTRIKKSSSREQFQRKNVKYPDS